VTETRRQQTSAAPRGWHPGLVETRFADSAPQSYDSKAHTVDAVLSMGSPVKRFYGTEVLRISPQAVILDRLAAPGIPVLDSHNQIGIANSLGRLQKVWFDRGALMGRIAFNATDEGVKAEGMVARGEIAGVSAGYRVDEWEITDDEGDVVDPERERFRLDDNLTFTAARWELLECSLCSVPADVGASIRSFGLDYALAPDSRRAAIDDCRSRMGARMRMLTRQRMYDRTAIILNGAGR
jgi:phage head maturation protease